MFSVTQARVDQLKAVIEADRNVGADHVTQPGSDAEEVRTGVGVVDRDIVQGGAAVIDEGDELELVADLINPEELGQADRRRGHFGGDEEAVVAVDLAHLVTAHRVVAAEADLLAGEEVGIGALEEPAHRPSEVHREAGHAVEGELTVDVIGLGAGALGLEVARVIVIGEAAGTEVAGRAEGGLPVSVEVAALVAEHELVDVRVGIRQRGKEDAKREAVVAALEIETCRDRFLKLRGAGKRNFIPSANLPVHAAGLDAVDVGICLGIAPEDGQLMPPRQGHNVSAGVSVELVEIGRGGELVGELLAETEKVPVIEARHVAVLAGVLISGIVEAAVDAQRKAILGAQDEIGRAGRVAGGEQHIGLQERIAVDPVEVFPHLICADRVARFDADFFAEIGVGEPLCAGGSDGADAAFHHDNLHHAGGDALLRHVNVDHRAIMFPEIGNHGAGQLRKRSHGDRLAQVGIDRVLEAGPVRERHFRGVDALAVGDALGLNLLGIAQEHNAVELRHEHFTALAEEGLGRGFVDNLAGSRFGRLLGGDLLEILPLRGVHRLAVRTEGRGEE